VSWALPEIVMLVTLLGVASAVPSMMAMLQVPPLGQSVAMLHGVPTELLQNIPACALHFGPGGRVGQVNTAQVEPPSRLMPTAHAMTSIV
jgi:hypothetical protein